MSRSVKLSKTYFVVGIGIAIYATIMSNVFMFIPGEPADPGSAPIDLANSFSVLSVAMLSLSAVLFSLPVIMLFVYDKNNGVLEYLLSTGLDQFDIFKGYVKASLLLASSLLIFSIMLNTTVGFFLGTSLSLLATVAVLTFAIGISEVLLVTVCMMAFSSLSTGPMKMVLSE